jgi:hypothetical protein
MQKYSAKKRSVAVAMVRPTRASASGSAERPQCEAQRDQQAVRCRQQQRSRINPEDGGHRQDRGQETGAHQRQGRAGDEAEDDPAGG